MRVWVNGEGVYLIPGMKVRHALIQLGLLHALEDSSHLQVRDQWGNILGLDGELQDGELIYVEWIPGLLNHQGSKRQG